MAQLTIVCCRGKQDAAMPTPPKIQAPKEVIERCNNHPDFAPFIHRDPPFTLYEYLKIALFTFTLLPLRVLFGISCFLIYWAWCRLCFLGYSLDENADRPHPKSGAGTYFVLQVRPLTDGGGRSSSGVSTFSEKDVSLG